MNKLNGPAKAAFERWFFETHGKCSKKFDELLPWQKAEIFDWLNEACETIQHAFLIEFFDFGGIYISIKRYTHNLKFESWYIIITDNKGVHYNNFLEGSIYNDSRNEITSKALQKANEIFNNLNH